MNFWFKGFIAIAFLIAPSLANEDYDSESDYEAEAQSEHVLGAQSGQHFGPQSGQHFGPQPGHHLGPQQGHHLGPQSGQRLGPQNLQHRPGLQLRQQSRSQLMPSTTLFQSCGQNTPTPSYLSIPVCDRSSCLLRQYKSTNVTIKFVARKISFWFI